MSTAEQRQLDRSMVGAVAWNAGAKWASQIATGVSTVIVARLLTPYDYGIVGMAGLFMVLVTIVSQTGIGEAIVTLREISDRQLAQLNGAALMIGAALVAVSFALSVPVARYFSAPPLVAVIAVTSIAYVITGLQVVPRALLQKELRFKRLAAADTIRNLTQALLTVALAWAGFRYWSLVLGAIGAHVVVTVVILCWQPVALARPRWRELHRELRYGGKVLASSVAYYSYDNADFLVAGKVLGGPALGNYNLAWTIACAPVEKIGNLITGVMPAFFAAVQHDRAELRRYVLRLTEIISYATFPASAGLALVADPLVRVVLGAKWIGAILPLRILGALFAARSISAVLPNFLIAVGEAAFVMRITIAAAVFMPCAFYVGSHWGTAGIASAWVIGYPLIMAPTLVKVFARTGMTLREYASSIRPAGIGTGVMILAVLAISRLLPRDAAPALRLAAMIAVGALSYLAVLFALRGRRLLTLVRDFRTAGGKDAVNADVAAEAWSPGNLGILRGRPLTQLRLQAAYLRTRAWLQSAWTRRAG